MNTLSLQAEDVNGTISAAPIWGHRTVVYSQCALGSLGTSRVFTRECVCWDSFQYNARHVAREKWRERARARESQAERGDGGGCTRKLRTARTGQARARGTAGGTRSDARRATHLRTARTGQARARGTAGADEKRRERRRTKHVQNRHVTVGHAPHLQCIA